MGTPTVTSYMESCAGVEEGGRTGLANILTAALFLCAIFFEPLVYILGIVFALSYAFLPLL